MHPTDCESYVAQLGLAESVEHDTHTSVTSSAAVV